MSRRRIIVGISGASGFQYGMKALQLLRDQDVEVHLVVTKGAEVTRSMETQWQRQDVVGLADEVHSISNLGASISSGSFKTLGMLVAGFRIAGIKSFPVANMLPALVLVMPISHLWSIYIH